ncbi:DUF3127 domain-containing protein [Chondrinema litorale]|uniref:DUF3127 domain-containing protein n=1 Tax=Chondrinema litorale TaxID=2994555 RepID=UPI002542F5CF|nr:DUF3127 domain-containing protein [Chondrinema litorale]UZR95072.1 DUF3127 domain-containing protein [Chondrinema litorale]
MSFEVKGKLVEIYDENQVTDKFKKREFVLEVQDGMYSEFVKMQLLQDKCDLINAFKVGDEINVSFNLKGRPYTRDGKTTYFTNLDAWRINPVNQVETEAPSNNSASDDDISGLSFSEASDDELPF